MKKCKYCKEEINKKATVCPHCRKKQKKSSLLIIILIIILIAVIGSVGTEYESNEGVSIANGKGNIDSYGNMSWEGDITNNGSYTVRNVKITITCYNEAREIAGKAYTTIKYINSGETLHFTANGLGEYDPNTQKDCEYEIDSSIY